MTEKSRNFLKWMILIVAGWLFVTQFLFISGSWRYKMTVVVETPEGIKTGSAVREVSAIDARYGFNLPGVGNSPELRGEAVVVDLGERGTLFALLKGKSLGEDHAKSILYYALPFDDGYTTLEGIKHYRSLKNARAVLTPEQYPMLVTFTDLNDPKSVREVDHDQLSTLFGSGVHLKEITVEMTEDRVTWEIVKALPWLPERNKLRGAIGGSSTPPYKDPTKTYLKGNNFSQGRW